MSDFEPDDPLTAARGIIFSSMVAVALWAAIIFIWIVR